MSTLTTPSNSDPLEGVQLAMSNLSESVREFAEACIARVKAQASAPGVAFEARSVQLKVRVLNFCEDTESALLGLDDMHRSIILARIVPGVESLVRVLDELLESYDDFEVAIAFASREVRRKHAGGINGMKAGVAAVHAMRDALLSLMERIDPTPDDYIETEMQTRLGEGARRALKSFDSIANSDAFTLGAFKKRNDLK